MSHLFASGDPAYASRLAAPWTTYSVSWTAASSNPSLGNGTLTGAWSRVGDILFFSIQLLTGTTTTYGTGNWLFSLPTAIRTPFGCAVNASCQAIAFGAGVFRGSVELVDPTTVWILPHAASVAWDATHPMTWAAGYILRMGGWQPVAAP